MSEIENVRVVIRIKPTFNEPNQIIEVDSTNTVVTVKKNQNLDSVKSYKFDYVLNQTATQTDVYCRTARPIVEKLFEGYNGTVLAYGQTGTGKTYTMTGSKEKDLGGVIPNTFSHIFSHIGKAGVQLTFLLHVTYLEIYNESVRDLLSKTPQQGLEVREHSSYGVFVQDLSGYVVHTPEELESLMRLGEKNRSVGATDVNVASSRSHTIFTITLESAPACGGRVTRAKLQLVDLAGSERQGKTHATGARFREASKINQSLSVLGNVISALVDGKTSHVPYRNSKLTRLLQDSLGGNSKTVMIATVSCSENDYEETVSTLRYANRAKNIQNRTQRNETPQDTMLKQFQDEIVALRAQLAGVSSEEDSGEKQKRARLRQPTSAPEQVPEIDIDEIKNTRDEQLRLQGKLSQLQDKIIVGGVNLLEKAQDQEFLLEVAAAELAQSIRAGEQLQQTLQLREQERIDIEERYSSLQDEAVGKTKKLKRLTAMIMQAKGELADLQQEQQRDMEGLLDTVRGLTRELQLAELIIGSYVPHEYQAMVERYIQWNEDIGEYQLKCVAYTGNNMRKRQPVEAQPAHQQQQTQRPIIPPSPYLQYAGSAAPTRKPRSRCSNVPRPTRIH